MTLHNFSLQIGKVSAACSCCRTYSHWTVDWTGLDWTGWHCHACCPPRARGTYSLAYILQGRLEQTRHCCKFVFDVLKYSYSCIDYRFKCSVSRQISAVPDLRCIVTWRLVESVDLILLSVQLKLYSSMSNTSS